MIIIKDCEGGRGWDGGEGGMVVRGGARFLFKKIDHHLLLFSSSFSSLLLSFLF